MPWPISSHSTSAYYEVVVIGGGPAGAAAAIALRRKGATVAIVERTHYEDIRVGETLPGTVVRPLAQLGLWEDFLAAGHEPAPGLTVLWGGTTPHDNDFIFSPCGSGWHVNRTEFDRMLATSAEQSGTEVYCSMRIDSCDPEGGGWRISIRDRTSRLSLNARWLVDATGRSGWLARHLGIRRGVLDKLVSLVAFGKRSDKCWPQTIVESCHHGWWYAATLPHSRTVVSFFTDSDLLPPSGGEREKFWHESLQRTRRVSGVAGTIDETEPLRVVAATSTKLDHAAGPNWLAIGDANQSHDPLSGHGVVKALRSGIGGADAIFASSRGDRSAIDRFVKESAREFERYLTQRARFYSREERWPQATFWSRHRRLEALTHYVPRQSRKFLISAK